MNYNDYRYTNTVDADFLGNLGDYSLFYRENDVIKVWNENLPHWRYKYVADTYYINIKEKNELLALIDEYDSAGNTDEKVDILQYIESIIL